MKWARDLVCAIVCAIVLCSKAGAALPPFPSVDPDPGQVMHLRRTLALLQSSGPTNRVNFRILVYGQSYSQGAWSELFVDHLKKMYPYVDVTLTNRAIAGFNVWYLSHTANADIGPWQPDLVFLNSLFDGPPSYERLYRVVQDTCTADVIVHADHPRSDGQVNESLDPTVVTPESYIMLKNYFWLPEIVDRFGFCWADIRTPWKQYLIDNNLPYNSVLLNDNSHFNADGHQFQADLLAPYIKRQPLDPPLDPWNCDRVVTKLVGSELPWKNGSMDLTIFGNRVDVEYESNANDSSPQYSFTLDNKPPTEIPDLYSFDRATPTFSAPSWPGVLHVDTASQLQEETWTLKTLEMDTTRGEITYSITGSKTGFDGIGHSLSDFTSNSGRVIIRANMAMGYTAYAYTQWAPPPDWEIYFNSVPRFVKSFKPRPSPTAGAPSLQTIFTGRNDLERKLRIQVVSGQPTGIRSIRVYSPSGRASLVSNVQVEPPPAELTIRTSDSSLTLSWPVAWGTGRIQQRSSIADNSTWSDINNVPAQVGSRYEITRPFAGSGTFYRWAK